jgi:hypothetical protein
MANAFKTKLIDTLRQRFGELRKVGDSQSLFNINNGAAFVYFRYSKVHPGGRTFFGLREMDLRLLEGHNSYICFLLGDDSPPLFIPYADFEEVFRGAESAKDGQYKVQLSRRDALELYVARQGRFNVEGYVGVRALERSLEGTHLRAQHALSHSQVQTLLAGIGYMKGYEIRVPEADVSKLDWSLTKKFPVTQDVPPGFDQVRHVLAEVDCVWIANGRNSVEGLFEVEHSTPVYSGLLRFNDVLLANPKLSRFTIVSNEGRRALFSKQVFRPTFRKSGLAELVSFLEYTNVFDWHQRLLTKAQGQV